MIVYPKIGQFKDLIRKLRFDYKEGELPILTFKGTVKLHGTNAAIVKYSDRIEYQSRSRVLSISDDNSSFMNTMSSLDLSFIFCRFKFKHHVAVYGEWCGQGIQSKVAISSLPKMFVIFGIKVDDEWVEVPSDLYCHKSKVYNTNQFSTFRITIDFNSPDLAVPKLLKYTNDVEECCPVANQFGVKGIGEGIVFTCVTNPTLMFKSKGDKHSNSKVTKLSMVNDITSSSTKDLVNQLVGEARLNQGLDYLKEYNLPICNKSIKSFIDWVVKDVNDEEKDVIKLNELDSKVVNREIVAKARIFFLNKIKDEDKK